MSTALFFTKSHKERKGSNDLCILVSSWSFRVKIQIYLVLACPGWSFD